MDVFKEYDHIFLTTVLLISSISTFAVAVCTLPTELHNSVWNYQYTDLSNKAQTTTLTFGRTTLTEPSNIRLNALGTILKAWTCISNLTLSSAVSVAVFKSDESYSDFKGIRKWVYLCMKLTKVSDDLFYFYLLSDEDGTVFPAERIYQSGRFPDNTVPVCSTFCQYTTKPRIRTLKKSGSSTTLPSDVSLCEPCDSACEEATTIMTSLETTQNTTLPSTSSKSDFTTDIPSAETIQKTTIQSTSTEMITSTEMTPLDTTQKTKAQSTCDEMDTTTETTPLETTQRTTSQSTPTELITSAEMTPLETTQKTTAQSTSTEMVITTEMTPLKTTQKTTTKTTPTEMITSTEMTPLETTQLRMVQSASTEIMTTTEMTPLETTQKQTTAQSTSTEMVTTTEMTPLETSQQTKAQFTSTEMDTTIEKQFTHKTTLPATSNNLVSTIQKTTIHIMVDGTEMNNDTHVVNTDIKDKTTMDTQSKGTEKNIIIYIGSSVSAVIVFSIGIIAFINLNGQSAVNTIENTLEKGEDAYGISPQICYLYKGKDFGFQKIAVRHWDCH